MQPSFVSQSNIGRSGQLLIELLVAIAVAVIVLGLGAQMIYVSLRSARSAADRNAAVGLIEEGLAGARNAAFQQWQSLYALQKDGSHYYPSATSGSWVIVAGDDPIAVDGATYTRWLTVKNACRDQATHAITGITDTNGSTTLCTASGGTFDPSTQWVDVFIRLPDGTSLTTGEYMFRWRNKVCVQSNWSALGSGVKSCPDTTYGATTNITAGTNLQLTPQ